MEKQCDGYFCYPAGCGNFITINIPLVIPNIPEVPAHLVRPKGPRPQLNTNNSQKYGKDLAQLNKKAVESHIKLIIKRRKQGVNWESITDEFCMKANIDMTDNTLRRYYRTVMPPELMQSLKLRKGAA